MTERGEPVVIDPAGVLALLYVVVLSTFVGFGAWAWLLGAPSGLTVAPFTLLVPVVGIAAAWIALGEAPSAAELGGAAVVLGGLALTVGLTAASARAKARAPVGRRRRAFGATHPPPSAALALVEAAPSTTPQSDPHLIRLLAVAAACAALLPSGAARAAADFPAADAGYHNDAEIARRSTRRSRRTRTIVSRTTIGNSYEGREMWAVKISDNVGDRRGRARGPVQRRPARPRAPDGRDGALPASTS